MNKKKLIKLIFIGLIFYFIKYVEYIPIYLFEMDVNNLTVNENCFLNLFENLCLVLILLFIYRKDIVKYKRKLRGKHLYTFDRSFRYYLIGIFLMIATNLGTTLIFGGSGSNNEKMVQDMITANPILMLLNAGIIAPITEELTFRKSYMDAFPKKKLFIVTSSLVFGLAHVIFSATNIASFMYFIPYSMLGLAFALMDCESDNVIPSICFHMAHNSILIILSSLV